MQQVLTDPAPAGHRPTVLVVEDDDSTRQALQSWLSGRGYSVLTATGGQEAVPYLDGVGGPIDAAVLDVDLPDLDGVYLCDILHGLYPSLRVVVCSGAATPADVERMKRMGARHFFRKPVDPDQLLAAVEGSLA